MATSLPPGPTGNPVLGSMFEFNHDRLAFLQHTARTYGDVARYRVAHQRMIQVSHPEGVNHIFHENGKNYYKGEEFDIFRDLMGNGLFVSEGKFWLRQRRLMQPSFHHSQVEGFAGLMVEAAERLEERLAGYARRGESFALFAEVSRTTMEIASESLMGVRVSDEDSRIGQALDLVLNEVAYRFRMPLYPPLSVPTPRNRRYKQEMAVIHKAVQEIIDQRRSRPKEQSSDLLGLLMEARDVETGEKMSDQQLRDEVLILYIAGHETTATSLAWTITLLARNPHVAARLQAEINEVTGGRRVTPADLGRLPYARNVIQETIRLYPPAWMTLRRSINADEICGYAIPAGALMLLSPYVHHHDPRWWPEPERFDPDRFTPEQTQQRPRYAYFPFGGGAHLCIGSGFAQVELQLLLAVLAQRFDFQLPEGQALGINLSTTLRPANAIRMGLREI